MSESNPANLDAWDARNVVAASVIASCVCTAFLVLYFSRGVLMLLFIAIVLATAMKPLIARMEGRKISHNMAVVASYTLIAVIVGSLLLAGTLPAIDQIRGLSAALPEAYRHFREQAVESPSRAVHAVGASLPLELSFPHRLAGDTQAPAEQGAQTIHYAKQSVRILLAIWATLLLAFYWSLQEDRVIQWALLLLPAGRREGAREVMTTMLSRIGAFLRGQSILCVLVGGLAYVTYLLLALPYAIVLAIVAGLCEAVPFFGPVLGFTPAIMVAASVSWQKALSVVVAAVIIQQVENYLLAPRIMDRSVGVHPMVTLLSFAAFGTLFGVVGVIFAIPLAAIIQVAVERFVLSREALDPPQPVGRSELSVLRYQAGQLVQDIRLQFREKGDLATKGSDHLEESIESIARDLARIIDEETASLPSSEPAETGKKAGDNR